MAFKCVMSVIVLVFAIKMTWGQIWADPSRTLKAISTVDAMASHGVFIRELGTFSTTMSEYKIIIPFSTSDYENAFKSIDLGLRNMVFQYDKYFNRTSWPEESFLNNTVGVTRMRLLEAVLRVQARLNETVKVIEKDFISIQDLINNKRVTKRVQRGLFDFIGKGLNFMFGLATQDEINETNQRIVRTKKFNVNLIESTRHLATIIKTQDIEISSLQKIQVTVLNNTLNLIQGFKRLVFGAAAQTEEILKITLFDKLHDFERDTYHTLTTLSRKINKFSIAMQEAIEGKLSSFLLPPDVLHNIILDIESNLPAHLSTLELAQSHKFFEIYNLLRVDFEHLKDGRKVFGITIPIVNDYDIFKLVFISSLEIPFSARVNSTAKINIGNNKIFAINTKTKKGFEINKDKLKQARKFLNHFYTDAGHYTFEDQCKIDCILSIQAGEGGDEDCSKIITAHSNTSEIIHLERDKWYFSVKGTQKLKTVCLNENEGHNKSKLFNISGYGELIIPVECTIFWGREVVNGIFKGTREVKVPGISKILTINVPPATLALSNPWKKFSESHWDINSLEKMELGLKNEMSYQYKNTLLHEKTAKLLNHVQEIMSKTEMGLGNDWNYLDVINTKESFLVITILISLICNVGMYFILRARMRKTFIKFLKKMNE